jgi:hypothetical protein
LTGITGGTEADVIPELLDARLLWSSDSKMRVAGFERVGAKLYAQTWAVEVTQC